MTSTRSLVESSLLVALAVVLFLASNFLPIIGLAFVFFCPAPLVVLGLRHHLKSSILGVMVGTLLVTSFMGVLGGLFFLLGFGILGVGLGYLARKFKSGVDIVLYGIGISLTSKLILMLITIKITGINPFSLDPKEMTQVANQIFDFYQKHNIASENLSSVKEELERTLRLIPLMFPALLTLASTLDSWLSYAISRIVIVRIGKEELPPLPPFGEWRFPKSVFWALVAAVFLSFIGTKFPQPNVFESAGLNLRLIVQVLFLVQGLSLIWFFLSVKRVGKGLRFFLVACSLFLPFFSLLTLLLGITDMWFDLRAKIKR